MRGRKPLRSRRSRALLAWLPALGLLVLAAGWGGACLVAPRLRIEPVPAEASAALVRAQLFLREAELADHAAARAAASRELGTALSLAPGWVAAQRLLDDIERGELRGVERLSRWREELARTSGDARLCYLAGRLEGRDGVPRFELALRVDPNLAWAHHALAVSAESEGRMLEARSWARRALERARDVCERGTFLSSLARIETGAGHGEEALALLDQRLSEPEVQEPERTALLVQRAGTAIASPGSARRRAGLEEALRLLGEPGLAEHEVLDLAARVRAAVPQQGDWILELQSALARRSSPARDRLRAELLLEAGPSPLALGLLSRARAARGEELEGALVRAARFSAGQGCAAVEEWLASLPRGLCSEAGLPRDARLCELVRCARRAAAEPSSVQAQSEFGAALEAAGWFREARALAGTLAALDLDRALALDARALAALSAFSGLRRSLQELDLARAGLAVLSARGESDTAPRSAAPPLASARVKDLDSLLERFDDLLAPTRAEGGRAGLVRSPRLSFGPVGELVHPGPRFSAADERAGLGRAGEAVGGLAAQMQRLGRFALFGEMAGSGPDGALLPLVLVEERAGRHLGVDWSGTVAWCESPDLAPRAARAGAGIAGAALHEGYWVDIDSVRRERAHWTRLEREYAGEEGRARRDALLATGGLPLVSSDEERRSRERRAQGALLGEGERVRLARIAERGAPGLDELVDATATHEEGHLCDRTRFLPLARHLPRALGFLMDCGFSPQRVMGRLEYRAQLVALCEVADPRVALAQVLDAAEGGAGSGLTPHAAAYVELLGDLLRVLDRELTRDPQRFPSLDAERTLAQQWHRLGAEELRRLARELAHERGLDRG